VLIRAGGEVDAANEHTWHGLVTEADWAGSPAVRQNFGGWY
jgi:hypothetical protein